MIGASAAVALSGIPFAGPIGAARVGYLNGQYVLNPTKTELDDVAAQPGRRRHRGRRADGRIGSARAARGSDAGRRGVRPPAAAGGDRADPRARRRRRQAAVGLAAAGEGRGADRQGHGRRRSRPARRLRDAPEAGAPAAPEGNLQEASRGMRARPTQSPDVRARRQRHPVRPRSEDRPQPDPGRRAAHRRPRHAHRAPDLHPHRRAAAHARLGAVHARRDAGAGRRHARHRRATSRSSTR